MGGEGGRLNKTFLIYRIISEIHISSISDNMHINLIIIIHNVIMYILYLKCRKF